MSHIPAAAMPHAKPHHDEDEVPTSAPARGLGGWGVAAAVAGGVAVLGAAAAIAAPLIGGRSAPKKVRRERKAGKATAKKSA